MRDKKPILEEIVTILIHSDKSGRIILEHDFGKQVMIPFTGTVSGPYFSGKVLPNGVDTQEIRADGLKRVSARYFIETDDGEKIFIENNGIINENVEGERYFRTTPRFITASKKYLWLNTSIFIGTGERTENGLEISIYRVL
ncbi:DUF3237 family protein [Clostridium ljungdahlii]|uniref:UPF0311 protein WY13_01032 n=1 Tax=Clostridium ljungdahlii TaxID=1538 RepID=A0A166REA0_9CLOT|nr:DUF3237 family protein [Clostridium ljungdahlii]OAA90728.1 hypothetical protein WY13_01032 [Clostridium ljungdahlii]